MSGTSTSGKWPAKSRICPAAGWHQHRAFRTVTPIAHGRLADRLHDVLLKSKPTSFVLPPPTISPPPVPEASFHRSTWLPFAEIGWALPSLETVSIIHWLRFSDRMPADTLAFELFPVFELKLSMVPDDDRPRNEVAPPTI